MTDSSSIAIYHMPTVEPESTSADRGVQPYVPQPTSTVKKATYDPTPVARPAHKSGDPASRHCPESATPPSSTASRAADRVSLVRQQRLDQTNDREHARSPRRVQKQTPCGSTLRPQTSRQSTACRHSASPRDRRPATSTRGHGDRDPYKGSRRHCYGDQC